MLPYSLRQAFFFRDVFAGGQGEPDPRLQTLWRREVREALENAWASSRLDSCLELGSALHRRGELSRADALIFARALNVMGDHARALLILSDPRCSHEGTWHYWLELATALAGVARLTDAADALARAEAMGGQGKPRMVLLAQALARVRGWQAAGGAISSLAEGAAMVRSWLVLGPPAHAVEALGEVLANAQPTSKRDVIEALVLAQEVARFATPVVAARLEGLVRDHFSPAGRIEARTAASPQSATAPGLTVPSAAEPASQLFLALSETARGLHQAAAARLGPGAPRFTDEMIEGAGAARLDLAACVGRMVIDEVRPRLRVGGPRKIVDMFLFADEFSLLSMKLEEMYDWVDHFVLVEAPVTFRGDPKPLHFAENKARFARFADKIVHVVVDTLPECLENAWGRQFYQRDCGLRAVAELCGDDDIVLVSDTDEVIDRRVVDSFTGPFASLGLRYYSYFFNLERIEAPQARWTAMLRAKCLTRIGAAYSRIAIPVYAKSHYIENAGWHFSKVRSPEELARKFSRNSNVVRSAVDRETLSETISRIRADGALEGYVRRDLDDGFPRYLQRHADDLRELIL